MKFKQLEHPQHVWPLTYCSIDLIVRGCRGRMVVGFTTTCTYAINANHYYSCEFESCLWQGVLDTTLCDQVCQWLAVGRWSSPDTLVSSTNKTGHDITEILLKVTLNTITHALTQGQGTKTMLHECTCKYHLWSSPNSSIHVHLWSLRSITDQDL